MNVLIVDDTPFDLHQMVRLVDSIEGAKAHGFLRMSDALSWCREARADLVVVDYLMPGQDGFDFVRQLREDPNHAATPIFLVTGFDEPRARKHAGELSIRDVFTKPVDAARFIAATRSLTQAQPRTAAAPAYLPGGAPRAVCAPTRDGMENEVVSRLAQCLRLRDPASTLRVSRVAHYSRLIGAALGLARADQQILFRAAPLLDIGMIGIPDAILYKDDRLTTDEYTRVKGHALDGYLMLRDSELPVMRAAAEMALNHHEKWNGSGYPRALREKAIPLFGRIAAVADVFAAVTSPRPGRETLALEAGRDLVARASGIHFDPVCVQAFLESWDQIVSIQDYFGPDNAPASLQIVS
jgi:response regulator RpfG family c-di-GMP phosphodiesterase